MSQSSRMPVLAFDIYGTLIDTDGVLELLQALIGDQAAPVAATWRDKQLEYAFRRGLMGAYEPFTVCTAQALDYSLAVHGVDLGDDDRQRLLAVYGELPAFDDVGDTLAELNRAGFRCFAFSNGSGEAVEALLVRAGLRDAFEGVVSCHDVESFKPDPAVYRHFLDRAEVAAADAWLVSGNPFDIIGARAAGFGTAWVNRGGGKVFDPWGVEPDATLESLRRLPAVLMKS